MKNIALLAALFSIVAFTSCRKETIRGGGSTTSETRELATFTSVQTDGSHDVVVYPSTTNRVVITGYSNLIPIFETNVSGGKLRLKFRDDYINIRNNNIKIELYTTDMSVFTINGSGKTIIKSGLTSSNMDLEINGSGDIDIDQNKFDNMNCKINGSGNINGRYCETDHASVRISGSGNVELTVLNNLDVKISGSGDVNYWGSASITNADISGSGKIKKNN